MYVYMTLKAWKKLQNGEPVTATVYPDTPLDSVEYVRLRFDELPPPEPKA